MSRILGLDTASNRMHWVADGPMATISKQAYGALHSKSDDPDRRRQELFLYAEMIFSTLPAQSHVFCEEPLALKNGKTTRLLGLAAGAIWAAFVAANPDAYWHWVDVASWKKRVVGRGNVNKEEIATWVKESHRFGEVTEIQQEVFVNEPDYYDAWCLMLYGETYVAQLGES